jgi:spermidine synthase
VTASERSAPLLAGLALSGAAGLVNQVAWQRGLKVFLGGSEALSAMTVVLVFMLGLGVGAGAFATRAARVRNPLRALGAVELALCGATALVGLLLASDLSESIHAVQRAAVSAGMPLRLLYGFGAVVVLGVPCLLMGVTVPLSTEVCQRQLGARDGRVVNLVLFANTGGAVVGAIASGFVLLPALGQTAAIAVAGGLNAAAGLLFLGLAARQAPVGENEVAAESEAAAPASLAPTYDDRLGFVMGVLSLGYEMYLFRALALVHEPLPYTFSAGLCGFLGAWSIGAWLASGRPHRVEAALLASAVGVAVMPVVLDIDRWAVGSAIWFGTAVASLPVVGFGWAYGGLVRRSARRWGHDVGRFGAWNTAGACVGIVAGTLLGYEMAPVVMALTLAAGLFATWASERAARTARSPGLVIVFSTLALVGGTLGLLSPPAPTGPLVAAVYDRDGAVEMDARGNLIWDGLWHSRLAHDGDHVGSANWLIAAMPALVHAGRTVEGAPPEDALVVGVGAGITVGTLAKGASIGRVDAYDINRGLESLLLRYPKETLNVATDPRVRLLWQDGRSGLALRPERYDLVTQQPLYLRQAGSSLLLSAEYFRLVQRRLKPGGIFAIYANAHGVEAQAALVRRTAASVFAHQLTVDDGYMILASDTPIVATAASFQARMDRGDALGREMAAFDARARAAGEPTLFERVDAPRTEPLGPIIRDDHPLVEYPGWATVLAGG